MSTAKPNHGFAAMHAEFWHLIAKNPLVFVVLPAILFLPVDILVSLVTSSMQAFDTLKVSTRLNQVAELVIGTFLASTVISAMREISGGGFITLASALRQGRKHWGAIVSASFFAGIRVSLGLICLIVPGIYYAVRCAFALPVVIFEGESGNRAVKKSAELTRNRWWSTFWMFLAPILLYAPFIIAVLLLTPGEDNTPFLDALCSLPLNVAFSLLTAGTAFAYLKRTGWEGSPVRATINGAELATALSPPSGLGRWNIGLIGLITYGSLAAVFYWIIGLATLPLLVGSALESEDAYSSQVEALYWLAATVAPKNSEAHAIYGRYLIGRDLFRAKTELAESLRLNPKLVDVHLWLASCLLRLNDVDGATAQVQQAEELGGFDTSLMDAVKRAINRQR